MSGKHESVGCFPGNTAITSISRADLCKLTYGTTYKTGVPGKVMRPDDKWENMIDIHNLGKKDTKYLKYQLSTAPLLDKSACSTRRDYVEHPLGDNIINSALAKSFKGGLAGGVAGSNVSAKNDSSYKGEFVRFDPKRAKDAKPKNFKPKIGRTMTITGMTDMLETRPSSHVVHGAPNAALAKAAETVLAKPNLGLCGPRKGPAPKTSYHKEFCGMAHCSSAPEIGSLGGIEDVRPSILLPDNHPCFHTRRNCCMSPGQ